MDGCTRARTFPVACNLDSHTACQARVSIVFAISATNRRDKGWVSRGAGTEWTAGTGTLALDSGSVALSSTVRAIGLPISPTHWLDVDNCALFGTLLRI